MTWFAVVEKATGKAVSFGTVTIQHSASSANLSMRRRYALLELT